MVSSELPRHTFGMEDDNREFLAFCMTCLCECYSVILNDDVISPLQCSGVCIFGGHQEMRGRG